jgi:uncharacterized paraquat-inducible protein A
MPRHADDFDADDDFEEDVDDGSDAGDSAVDDDDNEPTIPCPFCKAEIWEDAPRCPRCGNELGGADMPAQRRPWWVLITALLLLYLFVRTLLPW